MQNFTQPPLTTASYSDYHSHPYQVSPKPYHSASFTVPQKDAESNRHVAQSQRLTQFSTLEVELLFIKLQRSVSFELNEQTQLEDITKFLKEQKIIEKETVIEYLLEKNSLPLNAFSTLANIKAEENLEAQSKISFIAQIKQQGWEYTSRIQKKSTVPCRNGVGCGKKCEIY